MKTGGFDHQQWALLVAMLLGMASLTQAQTPPITPANDGTGTIVTPDGNQLDISGGSLSGDRANLFHSFSTFGLNEGQIANFLSNPEIRNILGRVVGGDPSYINGLIQVTGGPSNLFLMNPAGILFGNQAQLNLPGDFTATTATGIGFGDTWFNGLGNNEYQTLVGTPTAFFFSTSQPGAVVNFGNLGLQPGRDLTLIGGTVLSSGTLTAPGGNITIAAVPGESRVRISQENHLLSLEITSIGEGTASWGNFLPHITPLSLPELMTGGSLTHAQTVQVNSDGTIALTGSGMNLDSKPGDAIASGIVDVSGETGGNVQMTGDRVAVIQGAIDASGIEGGGTIRIGGDYQGSGTIPNADRTWISPNSTLAADAINNGSGGTIILWSDDSTEFHGTIRASSPETGGFVEVSGKETLIVRGSIDVSAENGTSGTILFDPKNITIANEESDNNLEENITLFDNNPDSDVTFNVETLSELSGSIILEANNDITISKPIVSESISSLELTAGRNITINADIDTSQGNGAIVLQGNSPNANPEYRELGPASIIQADGTSLNAGSGNINITLGDLGEVGKIQIGNATTTGEITLNAGGGNILRNSATSLISADKLALETNNTGGIGTETAPLRISVTNLEARTGSSGIFIQSPIQGLTIGGVSETLEGIFAENGGDIVLSAEGDLAIAEYIIAIDSVVLDAVWIDLDDIYTNLGDLATHTQILDEITTNSNIGAGNIDLKSINGSIDLTGGISSWSSMDDAGEIYLSAKQDIQLGSINSQGIQSSGNITVNSIMGSINRSNSLTNDNAGLSRFFRFNGVASYSEAGKAGNISLSAAEEIDLLDIFWVMGSEAIQSGNISLKTETGDIRASSIFSSGINNSSQNGSGGDISIVSGGAILVDGSLASSSTDTSGGNITLLATGDIAVGYIDTSGGAAGGDILIESQTAGIANPGWLYSSSPEGNAGNITLISQGDIVSGSIISGSGYYTSAVSWEVFIDGSGIGGDITLISQEGVISIGNGTANIPVWDQLNNGILNAGSGEGRGGNITLSAKGDIQTGEISTTGKLSGGAIELTSSQGAIATGEATLSSASASGNGGPITLSAFGNIQTGNLWSTAYGNGSGGNITLRSTGGNIDTQAGFLDPSSMSSMNGTVLLDAYGNITTHLIPGLVEKVNMNSRQGSIDLLFALAQNITIEDGGTDEWLRNEKTVRNLEVVSDADAITEVIGEVILQAHNDITVNEPITTEAISLLELRAGRSINLNADIDTSATNGNIILRANDPFVIQGLRDPGPGSVNMAPGTTLNAGSGQIDIAIVGKHWEVGNINLGNINTTGRLTVDANEGNIHRVSADSLLSAGSAIFEASVTGGIGTLTDPLRVSIDNIEVSAGRGGIYLDSPFQGIIIGGASDLFSGISSLASDISISATGDILFMENEFNTISNYDGVNNLQTSYSSSNISLVSRNGMINTSGGVIESRNIFRNGEPLNITLEAQGDIRTGDVQIVGGQGGGKISLISETGGINTTNGFIGSSDINFNYENPSMRGDDIILKAEGNIITGNIDAVANLHAGNIHLVSNTGEINTTQGILASYASEGNAGNITLEAHLNISTSYLNAQTYGEGVRGGDIILTSRTGAINTTLGVDFSEPENFPNFDIFSSNIMNYRLGVNHNIQTLAPGGTSGNIALSAPQGIITSHINALAQENSGNVTLNSSLGDIKTGVIFSASENGEGGTINVTSRTGDINIHHISTYSNQQIGGDITLWADGEVQINDIASYGPVRSGNVTISSNDSIISTGFIRTLAPSGTTGDIRLNTFGTRGDITTATLSAIAEQDAGDIRVVASDGSIITGRVESRATQGNSGNIQIIAPYDKLFSI
jgi:filamentous hemagglutinin family protein